MQNYIIINTSPFVKIPWPITKLFKRFITLSSSKLYFTKMEKNKIQYLLLQAFDGFITKFPVDDVNMLLFGLHPT